MRARDATGDAGVELAAELLGRGEKITLRARGSSMSPLVRDGDVLVIAPLATPRRGELVAAIANGRLLLHRVVQSREGDALLQGDALWNADGWFPFKASPDRVGPRLIGRAISLRRAGRDLAGWRLSGSAARWWLSLLPSVRLLRGMIRRARSWFASRAEEVA